MQPLPAAWRNFKRAQDMACVAAALLFAAAVVYAWRALPGVSGLKALVTLTLPGAFFAAVLAAALWIAPFRRRLQGYVGMSYRSGFGQGPGSILLGLGLLIGAAAFLYFEVAGASTGGRYPVGVFSAYGAGLGLLLAQAILTRRVERDPEVRKLLEE